MLMYLGWSTSQGQALMGTLNYPCGWEPSQPSTTTQLSGARSTTELIAHRAGPRREAHYAKSEGNPTPLFPFYVPMSPHGGTWRQKKGILLFRPRIISPWAWSYFTVEKQNKTFTSKFNSDVARATPIHGLTTFAETCVMNSHALSNQVTHKLLTSKHIIRTQINILNIQINILKINPLRGKLTTRGRGSPKTRGKGKGRPNLNRRERDRAARRKTMGRA